MVRLASCLCREKGIPVPAGAQKGVEIVNASDGMNEALFVLNHNSHTVVVSLDGEYTELLSDRNVKDRIILDAYDAAVLKRS